MFTITHGKLYLSISSSVEANFVRVLTGTTSNSFRYINDDFNGREYIRRELEPPQYPVLGEYNLQDSDAISQHLKWTSGANINLWVTSWSGPYSATDLVTRNGILVNKELGDTKIALFYE